MKAGLGTLVVVACMVGCGDDGPVQHDAGDDDAPTATLGATSEDGASISMLEAMSTSVGQSAVLSLKLANSGATSTGPIALALSGSAANDYSLDNQLTTCAGLPLPPGETCAVVIVFRPTAAGLRQSTLTFASSPGGTGMLTLSGLGVMPDLHFNPPMLAFARLETGTSSTSTIELRNDGDGTAAIDNITVDGVAFTRGFSTCGASLGAGESCDLSIIATASSVGTLTGSVSVTSNGEVSSAQLTVEGAHRVTVVRSGTGTGTVTSTPAGINCGATCSALFTTDVVLTATPGTDAELTGWSIASCGTDLTCTVPANVAATTVTASFALTGEGTLSLAFAGDASGEVRVLRGGTLLTTCFASCAVPIEPGAQLSLAPATTSTFGGFTGACTSTAACSFTAGGGTSTVTATFTKNVKEGWTRLLPTSVIASAYDGNGDLIVGTTTHLFKLSNAGSTIWSVPMAVRSIDTGPANTIYVTSGDALIKLEGSSATLWTRTLPAEANGAPSNLGYPRQIAVGPDGAVAVQGANGFARWAADGTLLWSLAAMPFMRAGIGMEPSGVVVIAYLSTEEIYGERYAAADGASLPGLGKIGDQYDGGLDLDANGRLVTSYSGHSHVHVEWATGSFSDMYGVGASSTRNGVASSLTGDVLSGYGHDGDRGWTLRRLTSTGSEVWLLRRMRIATADYSGTVLNNLAVSDTGQLAAVGSYNDVAGNVVGWVQVFNP